MATVLEQRQRSAASDLQNVVGEIEQYLTRDDADTNSGDYVALREARESAETRLADITASLNARRLAEAPAPAPTGETLSAFRTILREFDPYDISNPHSRRADIPLLREVTTADPFFQSNPTRIQVATLPTLTPTLDSVRQIQTGQTYDFVVPPPPVAAATVPEGTEKPTVEWEATKVAGSLSVDAHVLDVSSQTLEDDATAERTLTDWLSDGVRIRQDAKTAAAIAGATGTLTTNGPTLLDSIRYGKAELSIVGLPATTVYLHPADAAGIDLDAMKLGHTGPTGNSVLFGMTVIENPGIPVGTAIVGSMPNAVYFLYRNAIATALTIAGATNETTPRERFEHNLVGIRAEGRSAVHVVQPKCLVKCTVTETPPLAAARK